MKLLNFRRRGKGPIRERRHAAQFALGTDSMTTAHGTALGVTKRSLHDAR
jgi:hypothetical protein